MTTWRERGLGNGKRGKSKRDKRGKRGRKGEGTVEKREVKRGTVVDGDPGRETKTERSKETDQNVVIERSRWPSPVSWSQSLHPGLPRVCPS